MARNVLPMRAGLKMLLPGPNAYFARPIAKAEPNMGSHSGTVGGSIKASSNPVIIAEPLKPILCLVNF
jgi:hypothetical protein